MTFLLCFLRCLLFKKRRLKQEQTVGTERERMKESPKLLCVAVSLSTVHTYTPEQTLCAPLANFDRE